MTTQRPYTLVSRTAITILTLALAACSGSQTRMATYGPSPIEARALTKRYGSTTVVDDLSFAIAPGECLGIIGPNGAGKTTMMDVVTGKTRPDEGSAWFGDRVNLLELSEPQIAQAG